MSLRENCCIAAFLFSTRYIAAAIFGSGGGREQGGSRLFDNMLENVGMLPLLVSLVALGLGVVYLVIAEVRDSRW